MFQDLKPHIYHNEMSFLPPEDSAFVMDFTNEGVLAEMSEDAITFPRVCDYPKDAAFRYLFRIDAQTYYLRLSGECRKDFPRVGQIRTAFFGTALFAAAAAQSLYRWYGANRFCGSCGDTMQPSKTERAMVCPRCGNTVYPKICPAVIAAVTDGERLVLTRYKNRPIKHYALVAGFAEIWETIEQTVCREVFEETGLRVKNLRFYKSQPWVFTDTLLMGFFCELDGSDRITVQEDELSEARWYRPEEIPADYSPISLTGEMIERFRSGKC